MNSETITVTRKPTLYLSEKYPQLSKAEQICQQVTSIAEDLAECYALFDALENREISVNELLSHTENVLQDPRASSYAFQVSYAVAQERYKNLHKELVNISLLKDSLIRQIQLMEERSEG